MADGIELGKAYVQIIPSARGISGAITKEMQGETEQAGKEGGNHILSTMGKTIAAGAAAIGAAAGALVSASVKQFAEYEQLAGGAELLFGNAYSHIAGYAKNAWQSVQMSQNDYLNEANKYAVGLKDALKGNVLVAAQLTNDIITAQADIVAATGKDAESVANAFAGVMRGNYTMLDNLGIGIKGTQAGMEEVINKVNKWNKAQGEATHYQMGNYADMEQALVDYVKMQGLSGYAAMEAGDTIMGSLSSVKAAWDNVLVAMSDDNADFDGSMNALADSAAGFISNIIPRVESALKALPGLVKALAPIIIKELPGLISDLLPEVVNVAVLLLQSLVQELPGLIQTLIPVIITEAVNLINTLITMLPTLITTLVPALVDGVLLVVNTLVVELPGIIQTLLDALIEIAPVLIDGAINLLMGIIEALPVVINALLEALPGIIESLMQFLTDNFPTLLAGTIQLFMAFVQAIPVIIKSLVQNLPAILTAIWNALKGLAGMLWNDILQPAIEKIGEWASSLASKALEAGRTFLNNVISFFKELPSNVYNWLLNVISKVVSWGKELGSKFLSIGGDAVKGLWKGINDMVGWVVEKIKGLGSTILGAIKGILGIHSPSTEFAYIGQMMDEGLAKGVTAYTGLVENAVTDLADTATGTLQSEIAVSGSMDPGAINAGGNVYGRLLETAEAIYNKLDRLQVVLDSGELVGGISAKMDTALGNMQLQTARGLIV